VTTDNYLPIK